MSKKCSCPSDLDKCPYEATIVSLVKGFKDKPPTEIKECEYKVWIGPGTIELSKFTEAEWKVFEIENTLCTYHRRSFNNESIL
uniref:Uncharacterized protein n=1 Tax=viral metagenome TaxID=1070528 RepID=A0A6M3LDC9_9ZZZZ